MATTTLADQRVREHVKEVSDIIRASYPEVQFSVYEADDPEGVYIGAQAQIEDALEMLDLVVDRLTDILVNEGINICVIPLGRRAAKGHPAADSEGRFRVR